KAAGQFSPHQVVGGIAWSYGRHLLSVDARYSRWSDYRGPYVRLDSTLPLVGEVPALAVKVPFEDTYAARVGIESRMGPTWVARAREADRRHEPARRSAPHALGRPRSHGGALPDRRARRADGRAEPLDGEGARRRSRRLRPVHQPARRRHDAERRADHQPGLS